jgi:hypothetical protein
MQPLADDWLQPNKLGTMKPTQLSPRLSASKRPNFGRYIPNLGPAFAILPAEYRAWWTTAVIRGLV